MRNPKACCDARAGSRFERKNANDGMAFEATKK